jgi:hypothetical protein
MRKRIIMALVTLLAATPAVILFSPAPAIGANSLQSVLSPAGLNAYDTATSGSYFAVSETDFVSANNNLASVTKLGMTDADRAADCSIPWSLNYVTVLNSSIVIPANAYILGFATRLRPGAPANSFVRLVTSSTYKGSYSFLVNSNFPTTVSGLNYYLFKEPTTSPSIRYVGQWSSADQCQAPFASTTGGYLGGTTSPFTGTFSNQSNSFPFIQILYTTVDQWAVPATISVSSAGNAISSTKGGTIALSTTQNKDGLVTFKANGKNIAGCISLISSGMSATCNWKPTSQGSIRVTASLRSPSSAYAAVTSAPLQMTINKRSTAR